jgi:hypothetical protein
MIVAAASAFGAADPGLRAAGLSPCLFRGTGFDQKEPLIIHSLIPLSHPLDHSLSHINRIECHLTFLVPGGPLSLGSRHQSFLILMLR